MSEYRVYCLDLEGRSVDVQVIDARDDVEAVEQARALEGLRQCEVWQRNRLIAKITEFQDAGEMSGTRQFESRSELHGSAGEHARTRSEAETGSRNGARSAHRRDRNADGRRD